MELQPRATNYIEDIEGAHATEPKLFKDSMRDTKDMVNVGHRIKPKNKDQNPLEPVYTVRDLDNKLDKQYGYIWKSRPNPAKVYLDCMNLRTEDIEGALPGSLKKTGFNVNQRTQKVMSSLESKDIPGAVPNTKNKVQNLIKNRPTDPNND